MALEWNVFFEDFNARKIKTYNVFNHSGFVKDCVQCFREYSDDRSGFEEKLKRSLMYYFWSKCEYEVIISDWPPRSDFHASKVDVYDQVCLNWPIFLDYVWHHRREIEQEARSL